MFTLVAIGMIAMAYLATKLNVEAEQRLRSSYYTPRTGEYDALNAATAYQYESQKRGN